jgi:hypothetical protein
VRNQLNKALMVLGWFDAREPSGELVDRNTDVGRKFLEVRELCVLRVELG